MKLEACVLETPVASFSILVREGIVVASGFAPPEEIADRIRGDDELVVRRDLGFASRAVDDYFSGDVYALDKVPVEQSGGPFHNAVWSGLRAIPPGETLTYGELARKAGSPRAARAAGAACARNLVGVIVPCHRAVSTRSGAPLASRLNNYYYGLDTKRWLLEHERSSAAA